MGYTHYYTVATSAKSEEGLKLASPVIEDILKRHAAIVCKEFTCPGEPPVITARAICFNGKEDEGHETFVFGVGAGPAFCKTARKPYDLAVCEVLLALNAFMPEVSISSDGFSGYLAECEVEPKLDGAWMEAIANVREHYGIRYHVEIFNRREPYCDMLPVLDRVPLGGKMCIEDGKLVAAGEEE